MIVALFPGQGSQTPGFLTPWLEVKDVRERLVRYSEAAEIDLIAAGTEWDAEQIRDTKVAQPLIVAASLVSWHALGTEDQIGGVAGHSVGEFAAAVAAGILTDEDAMRLVGVRGRAMADAAAETPTGMSAIIGGDQDAVVAALTDLDLTPANYNGSGQIVAAGTMEALAALAENPPPSTRVIPLQVAGAFHTRYMAPAVEVLRRAAAAVAVADPKIPIWTNQNAAVVTTGAEYRELLVSQVASPVRWDLCMADFAARGVSGMIEASPAGTLTGLAKRALRGTPAVALKTPADLEGAKSLVTKGTA